MYGLPLPNDPVEGIYKGYGRVVEGLWKGIGRVLAGRSKTQRGHKEGPARADIGLMERFWSPQIACRAPGGPLEGRAIAVEWPGTLRKCWDVIRSPPRPKAAPAGCTAR